LEGDDYNRDFHSLPTVLLPARPQPSCVKQPAGLVACTGCHMVITINTAA